MVTSLAIFGAAAITGFVLFWYREPLPSLTPMLASNIVFILVFSTAIIMQGFTFVVEYPITTTLVIGLPAANAVVFGILVYEDWTQLSEEVSLNAS